MSTRKAEHSDADDRHERDPVVYRCTANLWIPGLRLHAGQVVAEGATGEMQEPLIRAEILKKI